MKKDWALGWDGKKMIVTRKGLPIFVVVIHENVKHAVIVDAVAKLNEKTGDK